MQDNGHPDRLKIDPLGQCYARLEQATAEAHVFSRRLEIESAKTQDAMHMARIASDGNALVEEAVMIRSINRRLREDADMLVNELHRQKRTVKYLQNVIRKLN